MYGGVPINPILYGQRMQLWVRLWDSKTCPVLQLATDQKRACRTLKNYTYISPPPQPASRPLATFIKLGSSGKVRDREASAYGLCLFQLGSSLVMEAGRCVWGFSVLWPYQGYPSQPRRLPAWAMETSPCHTSGLAEKQHVPPVSGRQGGAPLPCG